MGDPTQTELEAAAFRQLVKHLRERTDVQNIDLMELAGFSATAWRAGIARRQRSGVSRLRTLAQGKSSTG